MPKYKFSIPRAHSTPVVPAIASGITKLVTESALQAQAQARVDELTSESVSRRDRDEHGCVVVFVVVFVVSSS